MLPADCTRAQAGAQCLFVEILPEFLSGMPRRHHHPTHFGNQPPDLPVAPFAHFLTSRNVSKDTCWSRNTETVHIPEPSPTQYGSPYWYFDSACICGRCCNERFSTGFYYYVIRIRAGSIGTVAEIGRGVSRSDGEGCQ